MARYLVKHKDNVTLPLLTYFLPSVSRLWHTFSVSGVSRVEWVPYQSKTRAVVTNELKKQTYDVAGSF